MPDPRECHLQVLRCRACGALDPGPREFCPHCADVLQPVMVAGTGSVEAWTTIRRPPQRFRSEGPYHVAVVRLDADVRVVGRLRGSPPGLPEARVSLVAARDGVLEFVLQAPT